MSFELLASLYAMMLTTIAVIYKDKIIKHIKESIKQYIEYTEDIPIKYSVGK